MLVRVFWTGEFVADVARPIKVRQGLRACQDIVSLNLMLLFVYTIKKPIELNTK